MYGPKDYTGMTDYQILDDIRGVPEGTTLREEKKLCWAIVIGTIFALAYVRTIIFWSTGL